MAFDESIAQSMRDALDGLPGIEEKKMMGGLCFLVNGNMLGGASGANIFSKTFMFRVGKENQAEALTDPSAKQVEMGGRKMGGFIYVDADATDDAALAKWVAMALGFAGSLPAK